jgi:hypothetical protein
MAPALPFPPLVREVLAALCTKASLWKAALLDRVAGVELIGEAMAMLAFYYLLVVFLGVLLLACLRICRDLCISKGNEPESPGPPARNNPKSLGTFKRFDSEPESPGSPAGNEPESPAVVVHRSGICVDLDARHHLFNSTSIRKLSGLWHSLATSSPDDADLLALLCFLAPHHFTAFL